MPLTYAGFDLTPLTPDVARKVEAVWVREAPQLWSFPSYFVRGLDHLPVPAPPPHEAARLNTLVWPTGACRWGVFHALVAGANKAGIFQPNFVDTPTAHALTFTTPAATVTAQMYIQACRPLFVRDVPARQLWLLTLVDQRFYGWMREPAFAFTAGTTTWAQLLTSLVLAAYNRTPTFSVFDVAPYGLPTDRWADLRGIPLPQLIDAAAASIDLRFVCDLNGSCRFVSSADGRANSTAQFAAAASEIVLGGAAAVTDLAGIIPERVTVAASGELTDTDQMTLLTLVGSHGLAGFAGITGVADQTGWVVADAAELDATLVLARCYEYYNWLPSLVDATFRGVVPWEPTGMEDRIEWEWQPGRSVDGHVGPTPPGVDPLVDEITRQYSWDRVQTRVVPADRADRNVYGFPPTASEPDFNSWRQTGTVPIDVLYPGGNITGDASSFGNGAHTIIVSSATNTIHALPFIVPHTLTADQIAVWLQCAGRPADGCRLAIYDSASQRSIYPRTLVTQSSIISIGTATTSLTAPATAFDLTINVGAVGGFPAVPFFISIDNEVMEVTAVAGLVWTVSRAQKTSTAAAHAAGAAVNYDPKIGSYLTASINVTLAARKLYWLCVNSDSSDARFGATNDIFMQPIWGFSRTEFTSQYGIKLASAFAAYPNTFPSASGGITYGAFAVTLLHLSG